MVGTVHVCVVDGVRRLFPGSQTFVAFDQWGKPTKLAVPTVKTTTEEERARYDEAAHRQANRMAQQKATRQRKQNASIMHKPYPHGRVQAAPRNVRCHRADGDGCRVRNVELDPPASPTPLASALAPPP